MTGDVDEEVCGLWGQRRGRGRPGYVHARRGSVIYYIGVLGPLGRRERSELRAAKPHAHAEYPVSSQHFACRG